MATANIYFIHFIDDTEPYSSENGVFIVQARADQGMPGKKRESPKSIF